MNWYYADAGRQVGPITDEQLDGLLKSGAIKGDTLVWRYHTVFTTRSVRTGG